MSSKNNVAIIFDDLTEFFVMRSAIDSLIKQKIPVDIIVPYDSGYNGLAEHTFNIIKKLGYSPIKDVSSNKTYKVLLTPYPGLEILKRLKYVYHLRYPYSAISAKPNPAYLPEWKLSYDGAFSFNTYEPKFLQAYGTKYHVVPYWKYYNFKREKNNQQKPTLLILPTFGADVSCISLFNNTTINNLKKHYHIVSKSHHATHFNSDNNDSFKKLQALSDDFYDSDTTIVELLQKSDIVLSDNSGSTFEAICAGIPVALFAKDLNKRHLSIIDTLQYTLAQQKIIPYTNKPSELLPMLQSIKTYSNKQSALREKLFLKITKDSVSNFTDVIKEYLLKDASNDYRKAIHDLLLQKINNYESTINQLNREIDKKQQTINELEKQVAKQNDSICDIYNSTSWKITKPLRQLKHLNNKRSKND